MNARPDEVVAWQLRYRFWDGAPWGQWHGYPTEAMRNAEADMFSAGNWLTESRDLTDVAALQSANARLAEMEVACAQAVEFAEYVEGAAKGAMVERAKHYLSMPYSQELQARLRRAAAGEGDDNG